MSRSSLLVLGGLTCVLSACGQPAKTAGNVASLTIDSPPDGSRVRAVVAIAVSATGLTPERVELLVDGVSQGSVAAPPYAYQLATDGLAEGARELRAQGWKGAQNWLSEPLTLVVDRTAPRVVRLNPQSLDYNADAAAPIQITFSEAIDPKSVSDALVMLSGTSGPIDVHLELDAQTQTVLTVVPAARLVAPSNITARLSAGLTDLAGNPLSPQSAWGWILPTWQTLPPLPQPRVASADGDGAHGVLLAENANGDLYAYQEQDSTWVSSSGAAPLLPDASRGTAISSSTGEIWMGLDFGTNGFSLFHWDGKTFSAVNDPPLVINQFRSPQRGYLQNPYLLNLAADGQLALAMLNISPINSEGPVDIALRDVSGVWTLLPRPFGTSTTQASLGLAHLGGGSWLVSSHKASARVDLYARYQAGQWSAVAAPPGSGTSWDLALYQGGEATYAVWLDGATEATVAHVARWMDPAWVGEPDLAIPHAYYATSSSFYVSPGGDLVVGMSVYDNGTYLVGAQRLHADSWSSLGTAFYAPGPADPSSAFLQVTTAIPDALGRPIVLDGRTAIARFNN